MIISNISQRVLMMKVKSEVGTAFTLEHKNIQYVITARHLFKKVGFPSQFNVECMANNSWTDYKARVFYHECDIVDIAVLKLEQDQDITVKHDINTDGSNYDIGQDMYFLGYPYNYTMLVENEDVHPTPLIKKGMLSGIIKEGDVRVHLLDGHNNLGFSGGPVYCYDQKPGLDGCIMFNVRIMGVISGYRYNVSNLHNENDEEMPYFIKENSGIIRYYDINYVKDILKDL